MSTGHLMYLTCKLLTSFCCSIYIYFMVMILNSCKYKSFSKMANAFSIFCKNTQTQVRKWEHFIPLYKSKPIHLWGKKRLWLLFLKSSCVEALQKVSMCVCVCAILVKEQEEVLHTDSNKEYAFDKTTSASCVFYTKTGWFLADFLDVMCPQTEAAQVNSTTAQCTTKRAAHKWSQTLITVSKRAARAISLTRHCFSNALKMARMHLVLQPHSGRNFAFHLH